MSSKTLKVSEVVYDTLEAQKNKNETFDDVLREVLGITPDVEDAAAFLPDETRRITLNIIKGINELADFDHSIETKGAQTYYDFISPESQLTVIQAEFSESTHGNSMILRYRGMNGDLNLLTTIHSDREDDSEWDLNIETEYDQLIENITETANGSIRKWY